MSEEMTASEVVSEVTIEPQETQTQETVTETPAAESVEKAADTEPSAETKAEKEERLFKQAEVDGIVQKRLERERAKLQQEVSSHPALSYVSELAAQNNMTVEQFVEACRQNDKQAKIAELAQTGQIPDEIAQELYESRQEKQARAEMQKRMTPINELLKEYPNLKPEDIPENVWQDVVKNGKSLAVAYAKYDADRKNDEIAKLKESLQIREKNAANADISPGSVTGQGAITPDYISRELFDTKRNDRDWVKKNLTAIQKSRAKW